jgi:hypothetical protein
MLERVFVKLFFGFFFVLFSSFVIGQSVGFEAKLKSGFLMAHRGVMGHLPREHAWGGEVAFLKRPSGIKNWHHAFNFPTYGIAFYGSTVGNLEVLGSYYGGYGFMEFPFLVRDKSEFTGKVGCGLGYGTKVFDQEINPKNVAMSTHFNVLISLGMQYRYFFGKNYIVAGVDLTHFSNGSTKVPNLGINLPYLSLGFGRNLAKAKDVKATTIMPAFEEKSWKFKLIGVVSSKEIYPTNRKNYGIASLSIFATKIFSPKNGWESAVDFIYKSSIKDYKTDFFPVKSVSSIPQVGLYTGYILPLDKMNFILGMGVYLRDVYNPDGRLYHRIGMRYHATKHWSANLVLKSHWAKADYVEYGIGYTF